VVVTTLAALGSGTVTLAGGSLRLPNGSAVIPNALRVDSPDYSLSTITAAPGNTIALSGPVGGDGLVRLDGGATYRFTGAGEPGGAYVLRIVTGTLILDGELASPQSHISTTGVTTPSIGGEGTVRGLFRPVRADFSPGSLGAGDIGRFTAGNVECYLVSFRFDIAGDEPGAGYDQLVALHRLFLSTESFNNNPLTVAFVGAFTPSLGQQFTLIDDRFAGAVEGTFRNLPEGAIFSAGGVPLRISYVGGDGNDVAITVVPEPGATVTLVALPITLIRRPRWRRCAAR
jgi:fibronectin-binding autotransporter adhesin